MQTRSQAKFLRHEPCEKCGSSDGKAVYDDGTGYCFPCGSYFRASEASDDQGRGKVLPMTQKAVVDQIKAISGQVLSIPDRGIVRATCEAYGVRQSGTEHYYPYTDAKGNEIAWKIRNVPEKQFRYAPLKEFSSRI